MGSMYICKMVAGGGCRVGGITIWPFLPLLTILFHLFRYITKFLRNKYCAVHYKFCNIIYPQYFFGFCVCLNLCICKKNNTVMLNWEPHSLCKH